MSAKRQLLFVEDDIGLQRQLRWGFDEFDVIFAGDRKEALTRLGQETFPVMLLDLGLPPDPDGVSEGFALLEEVTTGFPDTKVIVVTGKDDRENAIRAVAGGAYDFYQKPVDLDVIKLIVSRAYKLFELEQENRRLAEKNREVPLQGVLASSEKMINVCRMVEKVAASNATTLLYGESGTGKELLARALHRLSERASGNMVAINCAAIPENLLESELFGYEKGAFTGAAKQTIGKIEAANGGTLFLDEIGDLSLSLQAKLLRFLQERVIERVGGREEIPVDARVLCATHRDLNEMMRGGGFREDLFYRVSEVTIHIPPLREREGDSLLIARAMLEKIKSDRHSVARGFSKEAALAIESYHWPGNVRELENKVKRATIMAEGPQITPAELELELPEGEELSFGLREVRERAEREAVIRALNYAKGNIAQAAALLDVSRPTIYGLMKKLNIDA